MKHFPRTVSTLLLIIAMTISTSVSGQYQFRPHVITEGMTDSIYFEAYLSNFHTHATFEIGSEAYLMHDDGLGGDRVAGDRIFTVALDPVAIIADMDESDAYRPLAGVMQRYQGTHPASKMPVFAQVRTEDMPDVQISTVSEDVQLSSHIINIKKSSDMDYGDVFREFTAWGVSNQIDFLNIVHLPSSYQTSKYISIHNDVSGLGIPKYDLTTDPHVPNRMMGVYEVYATDQFDGAARNTLRAYASQWIPYVGAPFSECDGWAVGHLSTSIMGYAKQQLGYCTKEDFNYLMFPITGTDEYRLIGYPVETKHFNDLALYMMGLIPPVFVEDFAVFRDQDAVRFALNTNANGYQAPVDFYSIDDVIDKVGDREPFYGVARTDFQVYTIVLSTELLSRTEMAFYNFMAQRGEGAHEYPTRDKLDKEIGVTFEEATGGAGTMDWSLKGITFPEIDLREAVCHGDVFTFQGEEFSQPGEYEVIIKNDNGIDTLANLILTFEDAKFEQFEIELCAGDVFMLGSRELKEEGLYIDTLESAVGCDSIVEIELTILPVFGTSDHVELCPGESIEFGGDVLTESGLYTQVLTSSIGCDSIINLELFVDESVDGAQISSSGNQQYYTFCVGDNIADKIEFNTSNLTSDYFYVITDLNGLIKEILPDGDIDFENGNLDPERVWGVSYSGNLQPVIGQTLSEAVFSDFCYELSANYIEVHKQSSGAFCTAVQEDPKGSDVEIEAYPNPVIDGMNLTVTNSTGEAIAEQVQIIDISGVVRSDQRLDLRPGVNRTWLDASDLAPGMYVVRLQEMGKALRFVKI